MKKKIIVLFVYEVKENMGKFKNKRAPQKPTNDKSRGEGGPPLSRKQKRKDVRKNKKAKKHNIFLKKHGKEIIEKSEENKNFVNEKGGQSSKSQKQSVSSNFVQISYTSKWIYILTEPIHIVI